MRRALLVALISLTPAAHATNVVANIIGKQLWIDLPGTTLSTTSGYSVSGSNAAFLPGQDWYAFGFVSSGHSGNQLLYPWQDTTSFQLVCRNVSGCSSAGQLDFGIYLQLDGYPVLPAAFSVNASVTGNHPVDFTASLNGDQFENISVSQNFPFSDSSTNALGNHAVPYYVGFGNSSTNYLDFEGAVSLPGGSYAYNTSVIGNFNALFDINMQSTPEPTTGVLVSGAMLLAAGIFAFRRRRIAR